jgi:Uma2 family endonuclease
VRLFADPDAEKEGKEDDDTIVQSDLLVICDANKRGRWGCMGAPDFVLEILSPSTREKDTIQKKELYLEAGVREYWLIDGEAKTLEVNIRKESTEEGGEPVWEEHLYHENDTVGVHIFDGKLQIPLAEVFAKAALY